MMTVRVTNGQNVAASGIIAAVAALLLAYRYYLIELGPRQQACEMWSKGEAVLALE